MNCFGRLRQHWRVRGGENKEQGAGRRAALGWAALAWACCLAPIVGHRLLPCTDLPQHLAISSLIWRLLHADPSAALYALALQPMPYYLAYAWLVPLVGLAGPEVGARVFFAALALAQVGAAAVFLRAARAPPWANLGSAVIFFGPLFYYGFVATMAGLPAVLLLAAALLRWQQRRSRRSLALAAGAAAVATLAHAVLALPCCMLAAASLRRPAPAAAAAGATPGQLGPSRALGPALLVGLAAGLPLLGALGQRLRAPAGALRDVDWAGPALQWHYLKGFVGPFDHGAGRAAHLALLLALATAAWRRRRSAAATLLLPCIAALALAYALCPRHLDSADSHVWGLGFRFLCVAELLALALVPKLGRGASRSASAALALLVAVHGAAQWRLWDAFEATALPLHAALRALPAAQRLALEVRGPATVGAGLAAAAGARRRLLPRRHRGLRQRCLRRGPPANPSAAAVRPRRRGLSAAAGRRHGAVADAAARHGAPAGCRERLEAAGPAHRGHRARRHARARWRQMSPPPARRAPRWACPPPPTRRPAAAPAARLMGLTALLAGVLLLPRLAQKSMFCDGLVYAQVARNLAADGWQHLWQLRYTATLHPAFYEHPPLGLWLLALAYRLLGARPYVERLLGAAQLAALLALMAALWRRGSSQAARPGAWWPCLLLLCCPVVTWACGNNMLDGLAALGCLLAVWAWERAEARPPQALAWGAVAATGLLAALGAKGPAALFVAILPPWARGPRRPARRPPAPSRPPPRGARRCLGHC